MLGSRRGRPSLIGRAAHTAARTALITKTATAVAGRSASAPAAPAPAPVTAPLTAAPAAAAPAGLTDDAIARLKQLAELHAGGILTDDEFAAQKARLLA